ncbi:hypothetical protein GC167_01825 [bacterium]|nr:hypothetical protein [bacterium]
MNTRSQPTPSGLYRRPLSDSAAALSPWNVLEALEAFGRELYESTSDGESTTDEPPLFQVVSSSLKVKKWPQASEKVFLEAWFVPGRARSVELRMRVFAQGVHREQSLVKVVYGLRRRG